MFDIYILVNETTERNQYTILIVVVCFLLIWVCRQGVKNSTGNYMKRGKPNCSFCYELYCTLPNTEILLVKIVS